MLGQTKTMMALLFIVLKDRLNNPLLLHTLQKRSIIATIRRFYYFSHLRTICIKDGGFCTNRPIDLLEE